MNLATTIELYGGGPGSGCRGPNCGRPKGSDSPEESRRHSGAQTYSEKHDKTFQNVLNSLRERTDLTQWEKDHTVQLARAYHQAFLGMTKGDSISANAGPVHGFTAERAAVHEAILQSYMSKFTTPQGTPHAIITGGLPGAGKSSGLRTLDTSNYIVVSADDIKMMLPEYNGVNAGYLHEESSYLANAAVRMSIDAKQNVVVDVTMKSVGDPTKGINDNVIGTVHELGKKGYDVHLQFTDVTVEKSIERVMERYIKTGRFVPPDYIRLARSKQGSNSANYDVFKTVRESPYVKSWQHFDNTGDKPKLVAVGGRQ